MQKKFTANGTIKQRILTLLFCVDPAENEIFMQLIEGGSMRTRQVNTSISLHTETTYSKVALFNWLIPPYFDSNYYSIGTTLCAVIFDERSTVLVTNNEMLLNLSNKE